MREMKVGAIAIKSSVLLIVLCMAYLGVGNLLMANQATAQDAAIPNSATSYPGSPYGKMAPIDQYLMDRNDEIALARSAAPDAISRDATVIVLTRHGYETAVEGKNGWVCWVARGWMAMFDHPEFWSPKVRAADCLNPPAARSILPYAYKRTELILAGRSKVEVIAAIAAALDKKELPALEPGAVSYMMSKSSYLTDGGDHNMPHVMFFESAKDDAASSVDVAKSPVMGVNYWYLSADAYPQLKSFPPMAVFLVGVDKWSDGTPGPNM